MASAWPSCTPGHRPLQTPSCSLELTEPAAAAMSAEGWVGSLGCNTEMKRELLVRLYAAASRGEAAGDDTVAPDGHHIGIRGHRMPSTERRSNTNA